MEPTDDKSANPLPDADNTISQEDFWKKYDEQKKSLGINAASDTGAPGTPVISDVYTISFPLN